MIDFGKLPTTIAIVGSRSFEDDKITAITMKRLVYRFVRQTHKETQIVSGGARGVDRYARLAALTLQREIKEFLPDESIPVPARFFVRNREIVDYIYERKGLIVAFIDTTSFRGTKRTIEYAEKKGVGVVVLKFSPDAQYQGVEYHGNIYQEHSSV